MSLPFPAFNNLRTRKLSLREVLSVADLYTLRDRFTADLHRLEISIQRVKQILRHHQIQKQASQQPNSLGRKRKERHSDTLKGKKQLKEDLEDALGSAGPVAKKNLLHDIGVEYSGERANIMFDFLDGEKFKRIKRFVYEQKHKKKDGAVVSRGFKKNVDVQVISVELQDYMDTSSGEDGSEYETESDDVDVYMKEEG